MGHEEACKARTVESLPKRQPGGGWQSGGIENRKGCKFETGLQEFCTRGRCWIALIKDGKLKAWFKLG